ncbi:MAG: hypothetical protein KF794_08875 [Xanthobacteraceae bacterium]|nr:MAG: hypothetical protein KF794_08875 [Xanthobacteraceae bacterium]
MRLFLTAVLSLQISGAMSVAFAQSPSVPGILAEKETALMRYEDKLAAYDAEQAVLAQDGLITGYDWRGPHGSSGTIIAGLKVPDSEGAWFCRRFIHVVHHANDGGLNPTFQATVCRHPDGKWRARPVRRIEFNENSAGSGLR